MKNRCYFIQYLPSLKPTDKKQLFTRFCRIIIYQGTFIKNTDAIVGEAILRFMNSQSREEFSRNELIKTLKEMFVEKYENSLSISEINDYESALKSIIFKKYEDK